MPINTDPMLRPPRAVCMRVLDRAFFQKQTELSAALIPINKDIAHARRALDRSRELLKFAAVQPIQPAPAASPSAGQEKGPKCILLRPQVRHDDTSTWSQSLQELVSEKKAEMISYPLHLDYRSWDYDDIMKAILPDELHADIASGYTQVGHVAHLNLRGPMLPYKHIIANVLIDKIASIRTVINKVSHVGSSRPFREDKAYGPTRGIVGSPAAAAPPPSSISTQQHGSEDKELPDALEQDESYSDEVADSDANPFRTFAYELLAGDDDMHVQQRESDCTFAFDYSAVYWNSRLSTEHNRLIQLFRPGTAVCDACAGVGPFVVPAAKNRHAFIWANDLNPACTSSLRSNLRLNKISRNLVGSVANTSADIFIKISTRDIWRRRRGQPQTYIVQQRTRRTPTSGPDPPTPTKRTPSPPSQPKIYTLPPTFSHYVLNLPATAIDFLPTFKGLYAQCLSPGPEPDSDASTAARKEDKQSSSSSSSERDRSAPAHENVPLPLVHVYCFARKGNLRATDDSISGSSVSGGNGGGVAEEVLAEFSKRLGHELVLRWEPPEGWTAPVDEEDGGEDYNQDRREGDGDESKKIPGEDKGKRSAATKSASLTSTPGNTLDWLGDGEAYVHNVRDVAPKKVMLCVSFRLPEAVAWSRG